ncbi:MAG: hypothetical protein OXG24_02980 [Gammaproteobacteria bacterium]|nr:hypothetical protein [Gammaproteobacteria bacterium]
MIVYRAPNSRVNTSVTREFRTFYDILVQGLISTWPDSQQASEARLEEIRTLFDEELTKVVEILEQEASEESDDQEANSIVLARFSRLDHVAQLLRRLCKATDNTEVSDEADLILAQHFSDDEDFTASLQSHFNTTGILPKPTLMERLPDLEVKTIPSDQTRMEAALNQAIEDMDIERVARISNILETPEPLDRLFRDYMNDGNYRAGLRYASVVFDDTSYVRLVNVAVPHLKENRKDLLQFLYDDPLFMIELEDIVGERLVPISEEFLNDLEVKESLRQNYYRIASLWHYTKERGGIEELVLLFEHFVENLRENQVSIGLDISQVLEDFLSSSLEQSLQDRVKTVISDLLEKLNLQDEYVRQRMQAMVCLFNIHESNVSTYLDILSKFESKVRGSSQVVGLMRSYYNGNTDVAYRVLLDFYDSSLNSGMAFYLRDPLFTAFKDQYLKSIDDILQGNIDDLEVAKLMVNQTTFYYGGNDPEILEVGRKRVDIYKALNKKFPDEKNFIERLIWSNLYSPDVLDWLEDYHNLEVDNDNIRMAYYITALSFENYDLALSMALDGSSDLRRPNIREEIFRKNDEVVGPGQRDPVEDLLRRIRGVMANYGSQDFLPNGLEAIFTRLQESANSESIDPAEVPNQLRSLWRGSQAAGLGDSMSRFYGSRNIQPLLIQYPSKGKPSSNVMYMSSSMGFGVSSLVGPIRYIVSGGQIEEEEEIPTLLEVLVAKAPLGRELESFLVALSPWERQASMSMYEQTSKAYQHFPNEMSQRLDELSARVVDATADGHEFMMWLTLANDADVQLTDSESDALIARARRISESSPDRLQKIASLLAKSGRFDEAVDCYEMLVLNQIRYGEFSGRSSNMIMYSMPQSSPSNILTLVEGANENLPAENAQALVQRVIPLVRPFDNDEQIQNVWKAFVVRALSVAYPPSEVIGQAERIDPDISQLAEEIEVYEALKLVQFIRAHYRARDFAKGHRYLKRLYYPMTTDESSMQAELMGIGSRYVVSTEAQKMASIQTLVRILGLDNQHTGRSFRSVTGPDQPSVGSEMFFYALDDMVDFEDFEAIDSLIRQFKSWLGDKSISQAGAYSALVRMARLCKLQNSMERAHDIALSLQEWLLNQDEEELPQGTLASFLSIATELDFDVESQIARTALEQDIVTEERKLDLFKSLRKSQEPTVALAIARLGETEKSGLSLLIELRGIAEEAMDTEYAESLGPRILRLENAYESIKEAGGLIKEDEEEEEESS